MIIFNSMVNPYIYAIRYNDFKEQAKILLGYRPENNKQSSHRVSVIQV